jgi:predicted PurR-regulated permease PerM
MGSRVLLWLAIVAVVVAFLYAVRSILLPFIVGMIVSAIVDPLIRKLRKRGFKRWAAVWIVFIGFFTVVGTAVAFVAPRAAAQLGEIQEVATGYVYDTVLPGPLIRFLGDPDVERELRNNYYPTNAIDLKAWLADPNKSDAYYAPFFREMDSSLRAYEVPLSRSQILSKWDDLNRPGVVDQFFARNRGWLERVGLPTSVEEADEKFQIRSQIESSIQGFIASAFGGAQAIFTYLTSSIIFIIFTPILTLFFLFDYDNFRRRFVTWIPPAIRPAATDLLGDIGVVMGSYVRGLTTSIALYVTVMAILMSILGVPFAIFLALLFGVFYLIPYIGNWISAALLFLAAISSGNTQVLFVNFGDPTYYAIICVVVFIAVGLCWDMLIHPNIVGKSVDLHPIVSFFVVFSGAALFGLLGMILAFPIAGTIKVILDRLIRYTTTTQTGELDLPRVPSRHQG